MWQFIITFKNECKILINKTSFMSKFYLKIKLKRYINKLGLLLLFGGNPNVCMFPACYVALLYNSQHVSDNKKVTFWKILEVKECEIHEVF